MSLADWVAESRQRFERQSLLPATKDSYREFRKGLTARVGGVSARLNGGYARMSIAGESAHAVAETQTEVRRAHSLNGEESVAEFLLADVDGHNSIFWDVGAYHGHYSMLAASAGCVVLAFEPVVGNRSRLLRHIDINGVSHLVNVQRVALSDTKTAVGFDGEDTSEMAVSKDGDGQTARPGDDIYPAPDVVKIDVEGHELAVIDGMADALQGVERIAVEVHESEDVGDVRHRLADAGLHVKTIETDRSQSYIGGYRY